MFKNLSKRNIVIAVVVILVLVVIGLFIYKTRMNDGYSIVYLTTGEVYIGKLTTFPGLQLKDSFVLQVTKDPKDPAKNNFQLQPIKDALWAPKFINLTQKNVIFYGPLLETSQISQTLAGKQE